MGKEKGRIRELFLDLVFDIVGGFLQAIGLHCFIDSINIAPGGATGMAILINRLTGLPLGSLTFLINIPLLAAAWFCLGKARAVKTLKTVFILRTRSRLSPLWWPTFPVTT